MLSKKLVFYMVLLFIYFIFFRFSFRSFHLWPPFSHNLVSLNKNLCRFGLGRRTLSSSSSGAFGDRDQKLCGLRYAIIYSMIRAHTKGRREREREKKKRTTYCIHLLFISLQFAQKKKKSIVAYCGSIMNTIMPAATVGWSWFVSLPSSAPPWRRYADIIELVSVTFSHNSKRNVFISAAKRRIMPRSPVKRSVYSNE